MRPIWKGHISFGLVNIPTEIYPAINHTEMRFHLIDSRNHARVRYERINEETGEEVPWDKVVKAYEYDKENFVELKQDEIKSALDEGKQLITIDEFISSNKLPGIFFEKPYYLAPSMHGEKGYFLLKQALIETKTIALAKVVIRTREYLAAVMPYEDGLLLNLLYFPQEIRNFDELQVAKNLKGKKPIAKKELDLAVSLIRAMKSTWDPKKYHDTYRDVLMKTIKHKIKTGKTYEIPHAEDEPTSTKVVDFMKLLKKSMDEKPATAKKAVKKKVIRKASVKKSTSTKRKR